MGVWVVDSLKGPSIWTALLLVLRILLQFIAGVWRE
jgi:hypothetical protein